MGILRIIVGLCYVLFAMISIFVIRGRVGFKKKDIVPFFICIVLTVICGHIRVIQMSSGDFVCLFSTIFIIFLSYIRGIRMAALAGLISGFLIGISPLGGNTAGYDLLCLYILPMMAVGYSGLANEKNRTKRHTATAICMLLFFASRFGWYAFFAIEVPAASDVLAGFQRTLAGTGIELILTFMLLSVLPIDKIIDRFDDKTGKENI